MVLWEGISLFTTHMLHFFTEVKSRDQLDAICTSSLGMKYVPQEVVCLQGPPSAMTAITSFPVLKHCHFKRVMLEKKHVKTLKPLYRKTWSFPAITLHLLDLHKMK